MAKKLKPSTEISKIYDHDFQFRLHFVGYFDKSKISGTNFIQDNLENFPFSPMMLLDIEAKKCWSEKSLHH